jgi:hypothetical protein
VFGFQKKRCHKSLNCTYSMKKKEKKKKKRNVDSVIHSVATILVVLNRVVVLSRRYTLCILIVKEDHAHPLFSKK